MPESTADDAEAETEDTVEEDTVEDTALLGRQDSVPFLIVILFYNIRICRDALTQHQRTFPLQPSSEPESKIENKTSVPGARVTLCQVIVVPL